MTTNTNIDGTPFTPEQQARVDEFTALVAASGQDFRNMTGARDVAQFAAENRNEARAIVAKARLSGDHRRTFCPVCDGTRMHHPLDENFERTADLEACVDCTDGTVRLTP